MTVPLRSLSNNSKTMDTKRSKATTILRKAIPALILMGGFLLFFVNKWFPSFLLPELPLTDLSTSTSMLFSTIPSTPFRVFGPMPSSGISPLVTEWMTEDATNKMTFSFYTQAQQRAFVQQYCRDSLQPFDALPSQYATQLWKYCVLTTQQGNVYWDSEQVVPTVLWQDLLQHAQSSIAIAMSDDRWHAGFLYLAPTSLPMASTFLRYWGTTTTTDVREPVAPKVTSWTLWQAQCAFGEEAEHATCPVPYRGHCCQVWSPKEDDAPILLIRDPWLSEHDHHPTPDSSIPFSFLDRPLEEMTGATLGMDTDHLPFIATVRAYPTGATPATNLETPNFFDILLMNDCLPSGKECFKCLKTGYDGEQGGDCQLCQAQCPCYCQALCQIRPPPKRLVSEWKVTRPQASKDPDRLIPRIIHQTWYEPVTKEKYPNMSRLIESFRQSGWHYEFYDDDRAAQFLQAHFPPAVREAYDAILPGAFKADLFRYCVLLIMGGVYADMDIMLESNLDELIPPSVGFMTPQDTPGLTLGHRHCLWNGFLAAAPGHPFLAQTVQNVVNHARNRYTSVDYDDMLCPDPVLAVSHTVDTLFTAGPCILGASINDVLQLHRQTGFEPGDIELFPNHEEQDDDATDNLRMALSANDRRFLIPGRSIILKQDKEDMGSHRFTWEEANMVAAATDMPDYDDRPKTLEHYSKTHEKFGVYGLNKLYKDAHRANEEFTITIVP